MASDMTALIVIAAIVLFFAIVLSIPVVVYVDSGTDGFKLRVRYAFLNFKLVGYPKKPKKEKPRREKKPKPAKAKAAEKKPAAPRSARETVELVLQLVRSAAGPMWKFIRGIRIRRLYVHYHVDKGDAAQTAIACGQTNAYLYGAYAVLAQVFRFKDVRIVVTPVFYEYEHHDRIYAVVSVLPRSAIACALKAGFNFIKSIVAKRLQTSAPQGSPAKESGTIE